MDERVRRWLRPRGIALVGATESAGYAARLLSNLIRGGYAGAIAPVSLTRAEVFGHQAYRKLHDVPFPVDVAIVAVPADDVATIIEDCGRVDVAVAVVISAGFGEAGPAGRARQERVVEAAKQAGILLVGPNCNGYSSPAAGVWASSFSMIFPESSAPPIPAGLVSQSGASAFGAVHARAQDQGFSFGVTLTTGNQAAVTTETLVTQLLEADVRVIAMISEEIRDGAQLLHAAARARELGKYLVMLKIGRSDAGRAAAATHTASLAGDDAVNDGVLAQHGIVRVDDFDELVECVGFLARNDRPAGRRVLVTSHSGGLNSLTADNFGREGFELPPLSEESKEGLREILGKRGHAGNPADITTYIRGPEVSGILRHLLAEDTVDLVVVGTAGGDEALVERIRESWEASDQRSKLVVLWYGVLRAPGGLPALRDSDLSWFSSSRNAAKILGRIVATTPADPDGRPADEPVEPATLGVALDDLDEARAKEALASVGLPIASGILIPAGAAVIGEQLPPGPWVAKLVATGLTHKTEIGALRLGLATPDTVQKAVRDLFAVAAEHDLTGARCLVESQVAGVAELYVGRTWNSTFGPVIGVGCGGVTVEADARMRWMTCPLSEAQAKSLLAGSDVAALLPGLRGGAPAKVEKLVEILTTVSRLRAGDGSDRLEIDLNPVIIDHDTGDPTIVDAVIVPARAEDA